MSLLYGEQIMTTSTTSLPSTDRPQQHRKPSRRQLKKGLLDQGRSALASGDWSTAEAEFRELLKIDRSLPQAYGLLYQAVVLSDNPERFTQVLMESIRHARSEPNFIKLPQSLLGISKEDTLVVVREALNKWPDSDTFNRLLCGLTDDHQRSEGQKSATDFCHDALVLATDGKRAQGLELLAAREKSCHEKDRNLLKEIEQFERPLISTATESVIYSEPTASGDVVIFFGGIKKNRFLPLRLYDMYFAKAGMAAIYLRDDSFSFGLGGIKPLGSNRKETINKITDTLNSMGCKRLLSVGTSAGAFTAIQYGLELDAKRILAFSPPTELSVEFKEIIQDRRARVLIRRLEREYSLQDRSLKQQIEAKECVPPIEILVGEEMPVDNAHAKNLETYPEVSICEIAGYSKHRSVMPSLKDGTFSKLLSW